MSKALRGLGALADGISQGLMAGEQLGAMRDERARRKRADDEAATMRADLDEANAAARAYLEGLKPPQQGAVDNYLAKGGTDGSLPDQAPIDAAPQAQAWQPSKGQLLRAAEARTNHLFKKGRVKEGVELWAQDERMRAMLRQEAAQRGMAVYQSTGDPTELIRGVYENIDDGWDLQDVKTTNGLNGPTFTITRKNQLTGKTEERPVDPKQLDTMMAVIADPKAAALYSLKQKLAVFESDLKKGEKTHDADEDIRVEGVKQKGRVELANTRTEGQKEVAQIRVDGTVKAAALRKAAGGGSGGDAGARVQSKTVLSDGRIALTMRDGSTKIATHDDGTPMTAIDYEKLIGKEADAVGKTLEGGMKPRAAQRQEASGNLPKAPAGLPAGLPAGSKQIGTSGGKPVYQTPDGKKFIQE